MSIGSRIKQRREELGYTQPQLAELVGVSKGAIGNYESNISSPNEKTLFRLFEILKCDANFLYQDDINMNTLEVFSSFERQQIKKYRTLDEHGKKAVDNLLDNEYDRCVTVYKEHDVQSASSQNNVYTAQIAAFGGGNSKIEVTEENLKRALKALNELEQQENKDEQ